MMRTLSALIEGLRGQPLVLGLIVLNVVYLVVGYLIWRDSNTQRGALINELIKACVDHKM
jgi:hypothetical protein